MRIGVTGASGFVGTGLMPALREHGHEAVALPRGGHDLAGLDAVIHLGGIAHRTGANPPSPAEFEAANAELPVVLYRAARGAGVRQFIQMSTIAVLSGHSGVMREDTPVAPTTDYDRAKARAEAALLAETAGPTLTIVRPPLIYGPGAKANLKRLTALCARPMPLPFGSVRNHRSLLGRSNLVDALIFLLGHPLRGIVHVTDGVDRSLAEMVSDIRAGFGRKPGLIPFPPSLLRAGLRAVSPRMADQLLGDQRIEMTAMPNAGWVPPHPPQYDMARMAQAQNGG